MEFYKVKQRVEELESIREWLKYAVTPEDTKLESLSNQKPLDTYFKNKIDWLISRELSRIDNAEVDYI